jgi:ABC-type uncharacterized transport system involved in gliding motility auxiliary subunit
MTRWTRGVGALVATIAVVGILVVVALISTAYHHAWDLTANRRQSLSHESRRALATLPRDVALLAFSLTGRDQPVKDLLRQYADASPRIRYEIIDPQREVGKARQYEITSADTIAVVSGSRRETLTFADEEKLTNAILKVTREGSRKVYFTTGHGERQIDDVSEPGLDRLTSALEDAGYATAALNLATAAGVPEDADAVVVAGPGADLLEPEPERLRRYLERGGHLMVLAEPTRTPTPKVATLVKPYGIELRDMILIEPNLRILPDPLAVVVDQFGSHPITSGRGNRGFVALLPIARPVIPADQPPAGVQLSWLARSSTTSWATPTDAVKPGARLGFDARRDLKGPVTVAVAATFPATAAAGGGSASGASPTASPAATTSPAAGRPAAEAGETSTPRGRLVVVGDVDLASNQFLGFQANRDLVVGAVSWLASENAVLSIGKPQGGVSPLFLTPGQNLAALLVAFLLPVGTAAVGVATWLSRRRRHG